MITPRFAALAAALLLSTAVFSAQAQTAGAPPAADPATQPAPAPAAKNGHDPNQVVCKRETIIGSRLGGQQICHTRAQWDQMSHDAAVATQGAQTGAAFANANGH